MLLLVTEEGRRKKNVNFDRKMTKCANCLLIKFRFRRLTQRSDDGSVLTQKRVLIFLERRRRRLKLGDGARVEEVRFRWPQRQKLIQLVLLLLVGTCQSRNLSPPTLKKIIKFFKLTDGRVTIHRNHDALERILQVIQIFSRAESRKFYRIFFVFSTKFRLFSHTHSPKLSTNQWCRTSLIK